jgi:hypothetical protein
VNDSGCGDSDIFTFQPSQQTFRAWQPFWDTVEVLFEFQSSDIFDGDDELPEWRRSWVAGVALLRTIGHVLDKVDAKVSPKHRKVIDAFWLELKSDRQSSKIFWEFIECERNNLLKTYSTAARATKNEGGWFIEFGEGSDAFDTFRAAVYWWREQLMRLEHALNQP